MSVHAETNRTVRTEVERVWHDRRAKMWRSLTAFAGDPDLASDAVAEAFAQALGKRERALAYEAYDHLVRLDLSTGDVRAITRCRLPDQQWGPSWRP